MMSLVSTELDDEGSDDFVFEEQATDDVPPKPCSSVRKTSHRVLEKKS